MIDPHTNQYLDRLKDEPLFLALAQKVSEHFTRTGDTKSLARVALRRMEHFYYKTDAVYDAMRSLAIAQQQAANVVQVRKFISYLTAKARVEKSLTGLSSAESYLASLCLPASSYQVYLLPFFSV